MSQGYTIFSWNMILVDSAVDSARECSGKRMLRQKSQFNPAINGFYMNSCVVFCCVVLLI